MRKIKSGCWRQGVPALSFRTLKKTLNSTSETGESPLLLAEKKMELTKHSRVFFFTLKKFGSFEFYTFFWSLNA